MHTFRTMLKVVLVLCASIISESELSMGLHAPCSYHLKLRYPLPFSVSYVRFITQQYKSRTVWKHLCNHNSHYEKYWQYLSTQRKPSCATTKLTVSKDEWNTKEDTGKSLKNALHVLRYAKRNFSGWSDTEQWKNQACSLSCYRLTLV